MKKGVLWVVGVMLWTLIASTVAHAHMVGNTMVYRHTTSGSGTHTSGTHHYNPAHVVVTVGADHGDPNQPSNVTSGGRYHDRCDSSKGKCYPAAGGDWAIDIARGGPVRLYLNMTGYVTSGTVAVDYSKDIYVRAHKVREGSWGHAACLYRQYDVYVEFTDNYGQKHNDLIGYVVIGHVNFTNDSSIIQPNKSRPSGIGGTIYWIEGVELGTVYEVPPGTKPSCNTGTHTHMEFYTYHGYGRAFEWHSNDSPPGPDGYDGETMPGGTHIHEGSDAYPVDDRDTIFAGRTVGELGGYAATFWMADNPWAPGH